MSEVNSNDLTEINGADDVFALYDGVGNNSKAGIEVELSFFDPSKPDSPVMDLQQNTQLKNVVDSDWLHNEPTSELLEVASIAAPFSQMKGVLKDTNDKIKILADAASKLGLKRSYFQELPDKTASELLSRIVDIDRYKIMYAPYRADMKKCVEYFAVCKSNQVSISPKTSDHMLENIRRLYLLAPFLFLLTDNSAGFSEGKPFKNHIGMSMRHDGLANWRGGGLPPYLFTAKSGAEFIENHINNVMNNPLFMYYDRDGKLTGVPSGDNSVTFNSLKSRGLNISSNYYLAQSTIWPDVKIATLKDNDGTVSGHRYEARMFGVGMHQHQSAFIITSALAFHRDFAAQIDELLARYGFVGDNCYELLQKSYKNAREHDGKFFDIAYGTGIMAEFAKEFADLIENIASDIDMSHEMRPILDICRSGYTDGKVNRILFPNLSDVTNFQKTYDSGVFENPNICAYMLFADKL